MDTVGCTNDSPRTSNYRTFKRTVGNSHHRMLCFWIHTCNLIHKDYATLVQITFRVANLYVTTTFLLWNKVCRRSIELLEPFIHLWVTTWMINRQPTFCSGSCSVHSNHSLCILFTSINQFLLLEVWKEDRILIHISTLNVTDVKIYRKCRIVLHILDNLLNDSSLTNTRSTPNTQRTTSITSSTDIIKTLIKNLFLILVHHIAIFLIRSIITKLILVSILETLQHLEVSNLNLLLNTLNNL